MSYLKQFYVTGRNFPNQKKNQPDVYFMKIFANNENIAKSRFWYFLKKLKKVKKIKGEIISIKTIYDKKVEKTRNFGIWLRYDSRTGTTNIFKDLTTLFIIYLSPLFTAPRKTKRFSS